MRGLIALTHAASTMQAWADWYEIAAWAEAHGYAEVVQKFAPAVGSNNKKVDRSIGEVFEVIGFDGFVEDWREHVKNNG